MPSDSNEHEFKRKMGYRNCAFMTGGSYSQLLGTGHTEDARGRRGLWLKIWFRHGHITSQSLRGGLIA